MIERVNQMKKVTIRSAVPIYCAAAVWVIVGLIAPKMLLKTGTLLLTVVLSGAVYFVGTKIFKDKVIEVKEPVSTGDAEIDRQIEESRKSLEALTVYNAKIPNPEVSKQLDRMHASGTQILDCLERNPSLSTQVRRFMNYYLPTLAKIMANYVILNDSVAKGENIRSAMQSVENSLGMIADAFDKQLDSLYRDRAFDMDAEVTVLETVLKSEGLTQENDFGNKTQQTGV